MRLAILVATTLLIASPALARHDASIAPDASTDSPALRAATLVVAPGASAVVENAASAEQGYVGETMRLALDLRFGPADVTADGVATWNANAPGRGTGMTSAGVSRVTYRIAGDRAFTTIIGLPIAQPMQMAAR